MRRKNEEANGNGNGHIKFRVIEFEIDGGNDTLAEGIKALTTALSKSPVTTTVLPPARALPASATPKRNPPAAEEAELPFEEATEMHADPIADEEAESGTSARSARPKRTTAPPPMPEILSDIDLSTGKVTPLKDYVAQKNPSDHYEKAATVALWYKENHGIEGIDANRLFTAYSFLDWSLPTDFAQLLRNAKFSKKWFDKGEQKGGYKLNMLGLSKVREGFGS